MLETPVLFLVFNRPDLTEQVLAAIREAKPKKLFVAADGPRADKPEDIDRCNQVRNIIKNGVDWDCELNLLFRNENLGCGRSPADAITWFFNHVEQGIILEDDCLPALSFFEFCDEILTKYKNDESVFAISGTNLLDIHKKDQSYFFSTFGGNWGWASWSRAWKNFDFNISAWKEQGVKDQIRAFIKDDQYFHYYENLFDEHFKKPVEDVWDYQWLFARLLNSGVSVVPSFNQIKNIGFGDDATHTFDAQSNIAKLNKYEIVFPLTYIDKPVIDESFDREVFEKFIAPSLVSQKLTIYTRIKNRLKRILSL